MANKIKSKFHNHEITRARKRVGKTGFKALPGLKGILAGTPAFRREKLDRDFT